MVLGLGRKAERRWPVFVSSSLVIPFSGAYSTRSPISIKTKSTLNNDEEKTPKYLEINTKRIKT